MKFLFAAVFAALVLAAPATHAAPTPVLVMPKSQSAPRPAGPVDPDFLLSQGEFEQARAGYEAVPKSSPKYEEALRQLGAIALDQNHLNEAEAMLNNARSRNPADVHCLDLLGHRAPRHGFT